MRLLPKSRTTTTEGALRPFPHVITDRAGLADAVQVLSRKREFVIDVETAGGGALRNRVTWVGLGSTGSMFLIPLGHPHGIMTRPEHMEKTPAWLFYPEGDERRLTKVTKQPSMAMVEHRVKAEYAPPPPQLFPDEVFEAIHPLLFSDRGKVGHNLKYDLMSVAKYYDNEIPPPPYHDTIIVVHVCDETKQDYGLKALVRKDYRVTSDRYPNLGAKGVEEFGLDEVARYLAKDLHYCWLEYRHHYQRLVRRGWKAVYDFEMSLYPLIMDIERTGFPIDQTAMEEVRTELKASIAAIERRCYQIVGDEFPMSEMKWKRYLLFDEWVKERGPNQPPQVLRGVPRYSPQRRLLTTQALRPLSRTPKQNLAQVTQGVLEAYSDTNELARLFLEWSRLDKLRGTFVDGLTEWLHPHNGALPTVHTSFKQHGTMTGRLSAEKPNLHQIPRGSTIRNLFVAGPGHVLICADYDQMELRCAGFLADDPEMIRTFRAGEDIHALAAATMLRVPVEEVDEHQRQVGKTQNLGTLYGASDAKIALVAGTSISEASVFIRRYYRRFAALQPWKAQLLQEARDRGDPADLQAHPPHVLIPPVGRLRRITDLYSPIDRVRAHAERQAVNSLVQGFAAYIAKIAMLNLYQRNLPMQMLVQVHDEIVFRVEERQVDDVLPEVVEMMTNITDGSRNPILGQVPLVVTANVGYTWAEAKGK